MHNSILLQLNVMVWYILLLFLYSDLVFIDQIYLEYLINSLIV